MKGSQLVFCVLCAKYQVSASLQHSTIASFCKDKGLKKGFYGTEDYGMIPNALYLEWKIRNLDSKYGGIVVFSLSQYRDCDAFIHLVREVVVARGLIFGSASEGLLLRDSTEFESWFPLAYLGHVSGAYSSDYFKWLSS